MLRFTVTLPKPGPKQDFGLVQAGVDDASRIVLLNILKQLRPHKKTGKLESSWTRKRLGKNRVQILSTSPVADWLDRGTNPHPIFPRGKALMWEGKARGKFAEEGETDTVFLNAAAGKHIHPGIQPLHYTKRAQYETRAQIEAIIRSYADEELNLEAHTIFGDTVGLPGRGGVGSGRFRVRGGDPKNTGRFSRLREFESNPID